MDLIKVYERYREKGHDEFSALGATFFNVSVLDMNQDLADLKLHTMQDIVKGIRNDKTFEEDKNERITAAI